MEIRTITCHSVYNAGAALQAYALMTYLDSLGHHTEIIDYKPHYLTRTYSLWTTHRKLRVFPLNIAYGLVMLPKRIIRRLSPRKKAFDSFTNEYLHTTPEQYSSNEDLKQRPPVADVYFAGSDQIWNPVFENGKDPAFFLDFAPDNAIRASYAASFSCDSVPPELRGTVAQRIRELDFVSVRESSGVELVKDLGINSCVQVLDPVFLLSREHWLSFVSKEAVQEKYVLVYDFDGNEMIKEYAQKVAKEQGLKIYSFFNNDYCHKSLENLGPVDFVYYIYHSSLVISNSFHATAFSIILNKNFIVFRRKENLNTRMADLLSLFGLEYKMAAGEAELKKALEMPDYDNVNQMLKAHIDESKLFIDNVLKEKKDD